MPRRFTSVIGIRPERIEEYKQLHANIWPEIAAMIKQSHIGNYSIHLREFPGGRYYLFSYFEYTGDDFARDMAVLDADPKTSEWLTYCEPCQIPLDNRSAGEWWASMEEVFFLE